MLVTFVGTIDKGEPTERQVTNLVVTVYGAGGNLVVREEFPLGLGSYEPVYVDLPEGEYYVYAKADGYRFPWRDVVQVGPEEDPLTVIEILGESSKDQAGAEATVLVYGWVKHPTPDATAGQAEPSHLASRYVGFPGKAFRTERQLLFTQITEEFSQNLLPKKTIAVAYDRNGFFSIELHPETWYDVSYHGKKLKIQTQAAGERDFRTLLRASSRMFLYDIR